LLVGNVSAVMPSKQARLCGVAHTLLFAVKGSFLGLGVDAQDAAARINVALTEEGPMPPAHSAAARIVQIGNQGYKTCVLCNVFHPIVRIAARS